MTSVLVAVAAFLVMEPVTAATHRFVMHGIGMRLHRSHHRRVHTGRTGQTGRTGHTGQTARWEANDAFPVAFAAVVCLGLWVGFHVPAWSALVPAGIGITAYGLAYAAVHDAYIHRRVPWIGARRIAVLDRLAAAHELHHRYGGAPYGMLLPLVPAAVRARPSAGQRVAPVPRP